MKGRRYIDGPRSFTPAIVYIAVHFGFNLKHDSEASVHPGMTFLSKISKEMHALASITSRCSGNEHALNKDRA